MKNLTRGQRFLVYVYGVLFVGMVALNMAAVSQREKALRDTSAAISERNTANAVRDSVMSVCRIKFAPAS